MVGTTDEILAEIKRQFDIKARHDGFIKGLQQTIADGGYVSLRDAQTAAKLLGIYLSRSIEQVYGVAFAPDEIVFRAISEATIVPMMETVGQTAVEFAENGIEGITKAAGLGMKPVHAAGLSERNGGIIDRLANDTFENVQWIIGRPIVNNIQNRVDLTIEANAEFHSKAGVQGHIVRSLAANGCCPWCRNLAGTYDYPGVPTEVYQRHDGCDCTVDYVLNSGEIRNMRKSGHAFIRY